MSRSSRVTRISKRVNSSTSTKKQKHQCLRCNKVLVDIPESGLSENGLLCDTCDDISKIESAVAAPKPKRMGKR